MLSHCNPEVLTRRFDAVTALIELQNVPMRNTFSTVHEALSGVHVNVPVDLDAKESRDDVVRDKHEAQHTGDGEQDLDGWGPGCRCP